MNIELPARNVCSTLLVMTGMTVTRVSDEQLRQWAEEAEAEQANRLHQEEAWADAEMAADQVGDEWALRLAFLLERPVMDSIWGKGFSAWYNHEMDLAWAEAKGEL